MSEILRHYFERRFNVLALESTTEELVQKIREFELDGKTKNLIRNLLESCDLVKFAKYQPTPAEIMQYNRQAKEIVDETKVVELAIESTDIPSAPTPSVEPPKRSYAV